MQEGIIIFNINGQNSLILDGQVFRSILNLKNKMINLYVVKITESKILIKDKFFFDIKMKSYQLN